MATTKTPPKFRSGYLGVAIIIILMLITLYMAFAFPFNFLQMKQTETTEIKAVIVLGMAGEESPSPEAYFMSEAPPENLNMVGYEQLTETGKRRMYSLGRFLRLKYYHLLLNGNPHLLYARASDTNVHLESAQTLISAMNPPKDYWNWFLDGFDLTNWQPIAVHSNEPKYDDLLSPDRSSCHRLDLDLADWKNSSKYQQLLNDFKHDLQTLRTNTGLEFEDDLDMLLQIESSLRMRKAFAPELLPDWFSASMADRLTHIADVCAQSRYGMAEIQRLYVGRLLHELTTTINYKIREHKLALAQIQAVEEAGKLNPPGDDTGYAIVDLQQPNNKPSLKIPLPTNVNVVASIATKQHQQPAIIGKTSQEAGSRKIRQVGPHLSRFPGKIQDPNVFVYIMDKQRFIALMNSLHIYTSQPQYGSALIIELHFDPISLNYFIRLLTSSNDQPLVVSEPLRVNPTACGEELECEPQQFEQNLRPLIVDRQTWQEACNSYSLLPSILINPQKGNNNNNDRDIYKPMTTTTTTVKPKIITENVVTTTRRPVEQTTFLTQEDVPTEQPATTTPNIIETITTRTTIHAPVKDQSTLADDQSIPTTTAAAATTTTTITQTSTTTKQQANSTEQIVSSKLTSKLDLNNEIINENYVTQKKRGS